MCVADVLLRRHAELENLNGFSSRHLLTKWREEDSFMGRPYQDIKIYSVQDRRNQPAAKKPWLARWQVDGRQRAKSFRTRSEAERFRSLLLQSTTTGEPFDVASGEPASWLPGPEDFTTAEWARRWLAEQWDEWAPRSRRAALEAMSRFVTLAVPSSASATPTGLRIYLERALAPGCEQLEVRYETWLARWSIPLRALNKAILAEVDRKLAVGMTGQALAPATAGRYRKMPRTCIRRAVALDLIPTDPWPPDPRGRSRRKALRIRKHVDIRALPDHATVVRAIDAIVSQHPGSRKYTVMTAVVYYAGLRPSEVVMLRRRSLQLPDKGWGYIHVTEADVDNDEQGQPGSILGREPESRMLAAKYLSSSWRSTRISISFESRRRKHRVTSSTTRPTAKYRTTTTHGAPNLGSIEEQATISARSRQRTRWSPRPDRLLAPHTPAPTEVMTSVLATL
ncbi:MAG: hypothetical protein ACR2LQ_09360 [Acidimicrobiales bacterium]